LIQSIGKLGSHSKASAAATHVVGTFVTTSMGGVSRAEVLAKSHNELLVIPLTTLLEMDVQQALTAEKLYKGALAAYDVAAFDMNDSFRKQAALDEKDASKPHGMQYATSATMLAQSKQALAESAKSKATFEKKLEDLCALVEAKKNHFLEENVFRFMLQERNYHRETYEALIESIDDSGLKEHPDGKEQHSPVAEPASPVSQDRKERHEDEDEDEAVAKDSPQLHTVNLAEESGPVSKEADGTGNPAVEVHLSS